MEILDTFLILLLILLSFIAGLRLDNHYHEIARRQEKEALEKQFLRLRARADSDDPCRPYGTPQVFAPVNTGDFDGDAGPISESFMNELKTNGKAKTSFRKSDLTK